MKSPFIAKVALTPLARLRLVLRVFVTVCAAALLAGARAPDSAIFYVSPSGSDAAEGTSYRFPFHTLERAARALAEAEGGTVYLMEGIYPRSSPLEIGSTHHNQTWRANPGQRVVLDGGRKAPVAIQIVGSNVLVDGLTLRHFAQTGILINGGDHVTISHNVIEETHSTAWTQAAILVVEKGSYVTVTDNIIRGADYSGIEFVSTPAGDLRHAVVSNNRIEGVCRRISDCGAIYITGRTGTSRGAILDDNVIKGYGAKGVLGWAIYLDDYASGAIVRRNHIAGAGTAAIHIHGGSDNLIADNEIEVSAGQFVVQYSRIPNGRAMTGNRLERNTIQAMQPLHELILDSGRGAPLMTRGNRILRDK